MISAGLMVGDLHLVCVCVYPEISQGGRAVYSAYSDKWDKWVDRYRVENILLLLFPDKLTPRLGSGGGSRENNYLEIDFNKMQREARRSSPASHSQ